MTIQTVEQYNEDGFWMITSPDLKELLLWGKDLQILRNDVPNVVEVLTRLNGPVTHG